MPDNDARSNSGRGAVRLENDRICVFERNGVYQARIRTEANRYRAHVGPFRTAEEAGELCSRLKAAGGMCIVQRE